jgi:hypothetical protein
MFAKVVQSDALSDRSAVRYLAQNGRARAV